MSCHHHAQFFSVLFRGGQRYLPIIYRNDFVTSIVTDPTQYQVLLGWWMFFVCLFVPITACCYCSAVPSSSPPKGLSRVYGSKGTKGVVINGNEPEPRCIELLMWGNISWKPTPFSTFLRIPTHFTHLEIGGKLVRKPHDRSEMTVKKNESKRESERGDNLQTIQ